MVTKTSALFILALRNVMQRRAAQSRRRAGETVRVNGFAWTAHNEELYSITVMLPSEQDENKMIKTIILVHPHHRRTQDWVVSSKAGHITEALVDRDLDDGPFKTPEAAMKAVGDYLKTVTR